MKGRARALVWSGDYSGHGDGSLSVKSTLAWAVGGNEHSGYATWRQDRCQTCSGHAMSTGRCAQWTASHKGTEAGSADAECSQDSSLSHD